MDIDSHEEIMEYFLRDARHTKKFRHIVGIILSNYRVTDLYDKEEVNDKCKGLTAMKFFKGQENVRVYCKEIVDGDKTFYVVAAKIHQKKSQKNSKKEVAILESIAKYEYKIQE